MAAGITLWVRKDHAESADAQSFLRQNKYAADRIRIVPADPPTGAELDVLAKAFGGDLWPLVDTRHPNYGDVLPRGAEDVGNPELRTLLTSQPDLLKSPILLTPKGALAGFREQKWRAFLDIGKGRA